MEMTHQLIPFLKRLRLSGILETLEARNQQAIDGKWTYCVFRRNRPRVPIMPSTVGAKRRQHQHYTLKWSTWARESRPFGVTPLAD
jgi:hypothetical protein